jgi:hypothetical protein
MAPYILQFTKDVREGAIDLRKVIEDKAREKEDNADNVAEEPSNRVGGKCIDGTSTVHTVPTQVPSNV